MRTFSSRRKRRTRGEFSFFHRAVALGLAMTFLPGPLPVGLAADLLRQGFAAPAATTQTPTDSGTGAGSGAEAAAAARVNANDALARNTMALQAVQAMQDAARVLAISGANNLGANPNFNAANPNITNPTLPDVPDGLGAGGLQIIGTPNGAAAPQQTVATDGKTTVNIVQNQQQASIDWQTFNIGKNTTLNFDQSAGGASVGQWIVFNRITDPTGNPTQILGSIQAQGQVYVINQNGIIFGGSSQINTHTLVAASLPINDYLVDRGLLNPLDVQYLFSAVTQDGGDNGTPLYTPPARPVTLSQNGNVTVQAGAQISSPTTAEHVGGRVALIGPNVTNNGKISTPDGQTILAAGLQVGFAAHSSSDPSLRGLDVFVGTVGTYAGTALNAGWIDAPRGNVTMTGKTVRHDGAITSTTSVALNGRIDLNASYEALNNAAYDPILLPDTPPHLYLTTGTVSVGSGAVLQILPESSGTETVVGTELALVSQINMRGQAVYVGADSTILAPNARITVNAGVWDFVDSSVNPRSTFVHAGGQIYIDSGATITVAGSSDVSVPVSQYILTVQLRSNELADSPLQRNGVLRGETVTVDLRVTGEYNGKIWYGTPLADLSGYVGIIQRTAGELTTAGGSITLAAGGSVVVQQSASLDVSGGWVNYQAGDVKTTQLISDGQIIDIANATPDRVYSGIYTGETTTTQSAWGTSDTSTSLTAQNASYTDPGGIHGANAGSIAIATPALALDGSLLGTTVAGLRQRESLPEAATLSVKLQSQQNAASISYPLTYPTGVTVFLRSGVTQAAADPFALNGAGAPLPLRADRLAEVNLSPELVSARGFGHFTVQNVEGRIVLPAASALITAPSGTVTLAGAGIDLDGSIFTRGGAISLTAYNISPLAVDELRRSPDPLLPPPNVGRGDVRIGAAAVLNTSGLVVDERASADLSMPLVTAGGHITLNAMTVMLAAGGVLDVSGGVQVNSAGKVVYGDAGGVTIKSGQDPDLTSVLGGGLTLGAVMRGFSGASGGSLSLQAPSVQVGGVTSDPNTLLLAPEFFSQGGFSTFTLTGIGQTTGVTDVFVPAVKIAAGINLEPVVQSWVAVLNSPQDGVTFTPQVLAEGVRDPVTLNFAALGARNNSELLVRGEISMDAGSRIKTDALGVVKFSGETVALAGTVIAPGGTIQIAGATLYPSFESPPASAYITVHLALGSTLSTAGQTLLLPNAFGLRRGTVLPGGGISISGNIVAEAGAVLDASGASGMLDLTPAEAGQVTGAVTVAANSGLNTPLFNGDLSVPVRIDSNGGTISIKGGEMLFLDATLSARTGGVTATGGTLEIASGRFYAVGVQQKPDDLNIMVTQNTPSVPAPIYAPGGSAIGRTVRTTGGAIVTQQGYFQADSFINGGFDALTLSGNVQFAGAVSINAAASLRIATGGFFTANAAVNLTAPYVNLGLAFRTPMQSQQIETQPYLLQGQPYYVMPTHGSGSLNVAAGLIDIGHLSLQNTGTANLIADGGDIRGNGVLDIAGDLFLRAGQVYPPTGVSFTLAAYDYTTGTGSITLAASGLRPLPLSAGGTLNVYASTINQGGTLVAPAGIINLGWDGSGSSPLDLVSGAGSVAGRSVPVTANLNFLAGSRTSVSGIDPITGLGVVVPYGYSNDGSSWIDPTGFDITGGGLTTKTVNTSASNITTQAGSVIDLRGGGDLYAYRWVEGTGGTEDILAAEGSFAVLPGYAADYAPYAPFNSTTNEVNLASSEDGYTNSTLHIGDRVYLNGGSGLQAGIYTLLPARYALLPGAFLVTPGSGEPLGSVTQPDGAALVSGYRFNALNSTRQAPLLYSSFEVAPASVMRARAKYDDFNASTFLRERAMALNLATPLLPQDAGRLLLQAVQSMSLLGQVNGGAATGGRGAAIDISSPVDILVAAPGYAGAFGGLVLNAAQLSGFGAESLLIGGRRSTTTAGTQVTVRTSNLTVDNAGSALSMPEIILVANGSLTLSNGASITQSGTMVSSGETLLIGNAATAASGNGALLRVSSDATAQMLRTSVTAATGPTLSLGAGVTLTGSSLMLDSTSAMSLSSTAQLLGQTLNLSSGRISVQFDNTVVLQASPGLVIAGTVLQSLQGAQSLSLLSYSSIDLYGAGQLGSAQTAALALRAGEIRGFNNGGVTVTLAAQDVLLDNRGSGTVPGAVTGMNGTLAVNAGTLRLGVNTLRIDQYANVNVSATNGVLVQNAGGLMVQGAFTATTPVIAGDAFAAQSITAGGAMVLQKPAVAAGTPVVGGLGATLRLAGSSITAGSDILLPSGQLTLSATGNIDVTSTLNVGGTAQTFFDQVKYTDAGRIEFISTAGSVNLLADSLLNLSASALGGSAGTLAVTTTTGTLNLGGILSGAAGVGGQAGSFSLTAGSLSSLSALNATLNSAGLSRSRSIRVLSGDVTVDGTVTAADFNLSVDVGKITVTGLIDAHGVTGGSVTLQASGSIILESGSRITVAADQFNSAGKGGSISLMAGSQRNGVASTTAVLDLKTGSQLDLGVAENTVGSAALGKFTGTLQLRAPQNAAATDLQMNAINAQITGASAITAEGYKIFTPASGTLNAAALTSITANATTFTNNTGDINTSGTIVYKLLNSNPDKLTLAAKLFVLPGAEVINLTGDLTLGTATSTIAGDWNLATARFGAKSVPGILTLRAGGNLVFFNSLNDGFTTGAYTAQLNTLGTTLPANLQSWSYRLTAGADFTAVDFRQVVAQTALASDKGSLLLGRNAGAAVSTTPGTSATTALVVNPTTTTGRFQVIRTGTGSIEVAAARDVQFLNQFASIYTAGAVVGDATMGGTFDVPRPNMAGSVVGALGVNQQSPRYPAQYTMAGGNVTITAQGDIAQLTRTTGNVLIADSKRSLPTTWLYRRGATDPLTGLFNRSRYDTVSLPDVASTTWWVDFSNFFENIGALGGGNVTVTAGRDIANVNAVVPTNARMPGKDALGNPIAPNAASLVELGGGDLVVRAGRNIDGGVYYVERGSGTLAAGDSIRTNSTRSPSLGILTSFTSPTILAAETWLPTTLFIGKSSFNVSARGDVLLGPVANPFLLPQGYNNTYWYKTYFSTYAADSGVSVTSLAGSVTWRQSLTLPTNGFAGAAMPVLQAWYQSELLLSSSLGANGGPTASFYQPWLKLAEDGVQPFATAATLMPGTLRVTAFSGNLNIVGNLNLSPSAQGTLELFAAGAVNGLNANGTTVIGGSTHKVWGSGRINLSDASPSAIPGVLSPFAYQNLMPTRTSAQANQTRTDFLASRLDNFFKETGSTSGSAAVLQTKQALHAAGLLHAADNAPAYIYARSGSINGFTLYSAKAAQIIGGQDIADVSLYLQNNRASDLSIVAAGRDIIGYNASTPLRVTSRSTGNLAGLGEVVQAGDIQISGPGTLQVLAARNLDLGVGSNNTDGTGVGITSIGNGRNPYLPFAGSDVVAAAGLGAAAVGISGSSADFTSFISQFGTSPAGDRYLGELATILGVASLDLNDPALSADERDRLALALYYLVLRDAGRDYNNPDSPNFRSYDAGFRAVAALFPTTSSGGIFTQSRDIRTKSGGGITLFAPNGGLQLAASLIGEQLAPPGIITESGGGISIFTDDSVDIGIARIFTLKGGDIVIWSSTGNIAAGSSAKTVQSAPPTRVIIDPQSANVNTDLAGLATGGGIGALATLSNVAPSNIDLIAPTGAVDAGDAGIRATGNLNIAATVVLNAGNIQVSGSSSGTPAAPSVASPSVAGMSSPATTATNTAAAEQTAAQRQQQAAQNEPPSIITVEVLGYGGGGDEDETRRRNQPGE